MARARQPRPGLRCAMVIEWKLPAYKPDNHWLDRVVGCAASASMQGVERIGAAVQTHRDQTRLRLSGLQRQRLRSRGQYIVLSRCLIRANKRRRIVIRRKSCAFVRGKRAMQGPLVGTHPCTTLFHASVRALVNWSARIMPSLLRPGGIFLLVRPEVGRGPGECFGVSI